VRRVVNSCVELMWQHVRVRQGDFLVKHVGDASMFRSEGGFVVLRDGKPLLKPPAQLYHSDLSGTLLQQRFGDYLYTMTPVNCNPASTSSKTICGSVPSTL
jgi:hypothetical protein